MLSFFSRVSFISPQVSCLILGSCSIWTGSTASSAYFCSQSCLSTLISFHFSYYRWKIMCLAAPSGCSTPNVCIGTSTWWSKQQPSRGVMFLKPSCSTRCCSETHAWRWYVKVLLGSCMVNMVFPFRYESICSESMKQRCTANFGTPIFCSSWWVTLFILCSFVAKHRGAL